MQIAIFGNRRSHRDEVERYIRKCLGEDSPYELRQYNLEEPRFNPTPEGLAAAFVIVEDVLALNELRTVTGWSKELPVVIVSDDPQYALEGIRCQVKSYILFPLVEQDVREALRGMGLEV